MPYSPGWWLLWMGGVVSSEHRPILDIRESARAGKYNHGHPSFLPSPAEGAFVACKPPGADNGGGVGTDPTCLWDQRVPWWGSCASPLRYRPRELGIDGGWGVLFEHPQGKSAAVCGAQCGVRHGPRRPRPQRLAAGEHSREAGAGPAPRGRERGLLWKRFCIRIKS